MTLNLSEKAAHLVNALASEEGILPELLIQNLLEKEDRVRHIIHPPFEGERRTKCRFDDCKEADTTPKEQYEL